MEADKLKKYIFSDLDGTLINSAKRGGIADIVIEQKNGEDISCVTYEQTLFLPLLDNLVPVTSRSVDQYRRIKIAGFSPKYALCTNGGILLEDGKINEEWYNRALFRTFDAAREFTRLSKILHDDENRCLDIRMVDELFLFTKSEAPEKTLALLGESELCDCCASGEKIYVVPKTLNKGEAVKALAERMGLVKEQIICAGDSVMDITMLNAAHTAIFTDNIPESEITAPEKIVRPRQGFEEFVTLFAYNFFAAEKEKTEKEKPE